MNEMYGSSSLVPNVIIIGIALASVLLAVWRKRSASGMEDGPVLTSEGLLSAPDLQGMAKGTLAGFGYNLLTNDSGRVMLILELGHNNWSHIVAYGDKSRLNGETKALLRNKWLEPATLEGDFPDYFHMYCNPEAQATVREVFTPDVMANFIDFCRAYDFEIFHDTLYISQALGARDNADSTTMVTDVTDFLQRNRSELSRL